MRINNNSELPAAVLQWLGELGESMKGRWSSVTVSYDTKQRTIGMYYRSPGREGSHSNDFNAPLSHREAIGIRSSWNGSIWFGQVYGRPVLPSIEDLPEEVLQWMKEIV